MSAKHSNHSCCAALRLIISRSSFSLWPFNGLSRTPFTRFHIFLSKILHGFLHSNRFTSISTVQPSFLNCCSKRSKLNSLEAGK